ncbi:MAG: STAS domain-containing protein [Kiritimatiellae bacterium]|nr:STAS domain-containing protein [Kiritimatiellia bacterium]
MSESVLLMEENRQGVLILHIVNQRLIEPGLAEELTRRLCARIDEDAPALLIDMGAVARISSVFFRSFIAAGKKANEKKSRIAFYGLAPLIKEGFAITGLDKLFKIYASEGKALAELAVRQ